MNRDIKFRAWNKDDNKMHCVGTLEFFKLSEFGVIKQAPVRVNQCNESWHKNSVVLMQYIGLKDLKGREIYEGDIYFSEEETDEDDIRDFYVITWIKEWAIFTSLYIQEYLDYLEEGVEVLDDSLRNTFILDEGEFKNMHYAGNIYENPEKLQS